MTEKCCEARRMQRHYQYSPLFRTKYEVRRTTIGASVRSTTHKGDPSQSEVRRTKTSLTPHSERRTSYLLRRGGRGTRYCAGLPGCATRRCLAQCRACRAVRSASKAADAAPLPSCVETEADDGSSKVDSRMSHGVHSSSAR